jgi:hypothetical protein
MEFKEYDGYIKWEKIYSSYNEVKDREDLPDWYKDFTKKEVALVGMSETNEDYYFVVKDSNDKESYESCVGDLVPIK